MKLADLEDRTTITVPELAALLQLSERSVYEALRSGQLSEVAIRIGGRWVIPAPKVMAFLGVHNNNGNEEGRPLKAV